MCLRITNCGEKTGRKDWFREGKHDKAEEAS